MVAAKGWSDDNNVPFNSHQSMSEHDANSDAERFGVPAYVTGPTWGCWIVSACSSTATSLKKREKDHIVDSGASIAWVPGNSFYYGMRKNIPNPLPGLYHRGANIGFGMDVSKTWTFGHNTLLAYNIAREEQEYLFADDLLAIQTINGAKALMEEDRLGSIEPGKRADLVIRSIDNPWNYPIHQVERDITLYSLTRNVDTVLVNGQIVVKDGHHTLVDEHVIYELAQQAAKRMLDYAAG